MASLNLTTLPGFDSSYEIVKDLSNNFSLALDSNIIDFCKSKLWKKKEKSFIYLKFLVKLHFNNKSGLVIPDNNKRDSNNDVFPQLFFTKKTLILERFESSTLLNERKFLISNDKNITRFYNITQFF